MQKIVFFLFFYFISVSIYAQVEEEVKSDKQENDLVVKKTPKNIPLVDFKMNPLAPAKAAFYSAILPGLGQAYNKKYWLIPVIYGGMTATMYFYADNDTKYNRFLTAYKLELAGKPHEFESLDTTALERGINGYKKQRDLYLFMTIGIYILNIVDANVDAHLPNKKIDTKLSYQPNFMVDPISNRINYGALVTYHF